MPHWACTLLWQSLNLILNKEEYEVQNVCMVEERGRIICPKLNIRDALLHHVGSRERACGYQNMKELCSMSLLRQGGQGNKMSAPTRRQTKELCDHCRYLYRYHKTLFCLVAIVSQLILTCLIWFIVYWYPNMTGTKYFFIRKRLATTKEV